MYKNLEKKLSLLPEPTPFKIKTFDELLAENIADAKTILSTDESEWLPLESDPYMKKLRVLTLRQTHNIIDKKETFRQLLITTATGVDLDHLGAGEYVFRDSGEYPYTNFEFKLLVANDEDITIPANLLLNSGDDVYKAHVVSDVLIPAGDLTAIVKVELEQFIVQSDVKTENLVTELTYALSIKQLDIFSNGAILVSLVLIQFTSWQIIDSIIGGLIAIYIIFEAYKLIKEGVYVLLDGALEDKQVEYIEHILETEEGLTSYHFLKTRTSGNNNFVDVHLVFTSEISLLEAHRISDKIEEQISMLDPTREWVMNMHLDPYDDSIAEHHH